MKTPKPKTLADITAQIAKCVDKMSRLKAGCDGHRQLAEKRAKLETAKASYLAMHSDVLSKSITAADGTPDAVRAARAASSSPLINVREIAELVEVARERMREEKRLLQARELLKGHPVAVGTAREHVATIARDQVSDEPAWTAFRRSRLVESDHPAFSRRDS